MIVMTIYLGRMFTLRVLVTLIVFTMVLMIVFEVLMVKAMLMLWKTCESDQQQFDFRDDFDDRVSVADFGYGHDAIDKFSICECRSFAHNYTIRE